MGRFYGSMLIDMIWKRIPYPQRAERDRAALQAGGRMPPCKADAHNNPEDVSTRTQKNREQLGAGGGGGGCFHRSRHFRHIFPIKMSAFAAGIESRMAINEDTEYLICCQRLPW